ncbi:hypothetical protein [Nitrosomonas supralitoralis]|uniref:Entericidin EcnAB n=1 Tax=Nitrosomonas supralitoralis TaxID=2116706 RepID=A0A2P7NX29_9PROT|nr:hypothetical protein [Nitrosomonas supralitoralis]PSJ17985.1 hypothetical protein C7H79_05560 [Nitrosomonas supralitoralis]
MNKLILSIILILSVFILTGCAEGPAERAGETIDRGIGNSKDAVSDAVEDAGDKIEDATDRY